MALRRALACFALIRRFAPPSPSKGKASAAERIFYILPLILPVIRRCLCVSQTTVAAFPFEGEGGAPAPDEGGRTGLTFEPNIFGTTPLSPRVISEQMTSS